MANSCPCSTWTGEPPFEAIQQLQGIQDDDIDDLLDEQRAYENKRKDTTKPPKN